MLVKFVVHDSWGRFAVGGYEGRGVELRTRAGLTRLAPASLLSHGDCAKYQVLRSRKGDSLLAHSEAVGALRTTYLILGTSCWGFAPSTWRPPMGAKVLTRR